MCIRDSTHSIGSVMYTDYILYFQLSGVILLLSMVGAIILTYRKRENVKREDQIQINFFDENNNFRNSLLIAVDNNQVIDLSAITIDKDCEITLFPPIAGG